MGETSNARIWDTVALLTLFDAVEKSHGRVDGALKVQKLTFLAEVEAAQDHGLRAAHFRFFRYTFGPYSGLLVKRAADLAERELVTRGGALTKRGRYILDYIAGEAEASDTASEVLDIWRTVGRKFAKRTGTSLKEYVYGLRVPVADFDGLPMRVRDIPMGLDIIDPNRDDTLVDVDPFSDEVIEEINAELAMDPAKLHKDNASYRRTIDDALKRAAIACSETRVATVS